MASAANQRPGLTTFGWLVLGGAAAALLSSKDRREKVMNAAKDLAGKFTPSSAGKGGTDSPAS